MVEHDLYRTVQAEEDDSFRPPTSACGFVVKVGCYRGACRRRKFWKHWIVVSGPLCHASNSSGDSPEGSDCSLSLGSVSPRGGH